MVFTATNATLQTAVNGWCDGSITASTPLDVFTVLGGTYGAIGDWDVSAVTNMQEIFKYKGEFNDDISGWDVSNVTNMSQMFAGADAFNQPIGNWDVSKVTDTSYMFYVTRAFNQPIGNWNVSSVTDMSGMFFYGYVFNQPIGNWDVSSVTDMNGMFYFSEFNQPISDWDVSSVTDMSKMFNKAKQFNQYIRNWDASNVTSLDDMFSGADALHESYDGTTGFYDTPTHDFFNKTPITQANIQTAVDAWCTDPTTAEATYGNIKNWDVSAVTNMSRLFLEKTTFNDDISGWDVSNVTDMKQMFYQAVVFNQDIGNWDVSNVTNMYYMFYQAAVFNQDIGNWDVSNVTNMSFMFTNAKAFNQDINGWIVSNVTDMSFMFYDAQAFNQPIGDWDVSNVTNMYYTFTGAYAFNQPIGSWNVSKVNNMEGMFQAALAFNQPIGNWIVSSVTDMKWMFYNAPVFNQDISDWNVSSATNMKGMFMSAQAFNQPIGDWDVSNVTDMSEMFKGAVAFNQPIGDWNVSSVTTMDSMFRGATVFNQPIGDWDVSNVWDLEGLLWSAIAFNQPIGDWDVSNVVNMSTMFYGAEAFNQPIGNWNVSNVTNMYYTFAGAKAFNQDISGWIVSNVTYMHNMFAYTQSFNQPIGDWDVSSAKNMSAMFSNSAFNQSINDWDVSNVTDFTHMFDTNAAFYQSIRVWAVGNSANTTNMFYKATGLQKYYEGTDLYTATPSPSGFFNLGYTPPEITIIGANPVTIQAKSTYTDQGATATDSVGNIVTVVSDTSNVNINLIGTYTVTYNATDSNGNAAIQRTRTVNVVDTQRPIITLVGDETVTFVVNTPGGYVDAGATATDNYYGDITSEIVTASDVITTALGSYTVTYNLTDDSGNKAYEVTRTVNVVDTAPTITITGDSIVHVNLGDTYVESGATATDKLDGTLTVTTYSGDVDTNKMGTYKVSYTATNSVGLSTTVYRQVVVVDLHKPIITLIGGGNLQVEGELPVTININSDYVDAGAIAMDYVDGNISSEIVTGGLPLDTSILGTHTVTFNVTDTNGLAAPEVTRTVNVIDTTPTITLNGSSKVTVDIGITYVDPGATATDAAEGDITSKIVTVGLPVDTNILGTHTISYTVTNNAGLSATEHRKVTVADPYFPTILLKGTTPTTVEKYSHYKDAGVTATDPIDGTIPADQITTTSNVNTSIVGTYTVIYKATDVEGNTSKAIRSVIVVDDPPLITLNGLPPYEKTVQQGQLYTDSIDEGGGATAGDSVDGDLTHAITTNIDDLDTTKPGLFTLRYNVSNIDGLAAKEVTRIINVHDPNYPIILIASSIDGLITDTGTIEKGSVYTDPGATATDVYYDNDTLTSNIVTVNSVDPSTLGTYTVTYNVSNPAGNAAIERIRTITVVPGNPTITLHPSSPETVAYGKTYIEPGYTAIDFRGTDISADVQTNVADLDTKVMGDFILTYNVKDEFQVAATEQTRTVHIYDPYPPTITMTSSTDGTITNTGTIEKGSVYTDPGATAIDHVDGIITDKIKTVNNVDPTKVGTYTVTYNVTDAEGNTAQERTRTIKVVDIPPTITLVGESTVTVDYGKTYTDAGATATDYLGRDLTSNIKTNATDLDTKIVGTFTVTYNVVDEYLLAATEVTRSVIVVDPYFPTISLIGQTPITVEKNSIYNLTVDAGATAWDKIDGDITSKIITNISDVNTSIVGSYTVTYNVTDAEGNSATEVTRTVKVIDSPPVITITEPNPISYQAKSTIPYKDPGASASDIIDGDLTTSITSNIGDLDTTKPNQFSLKYHVVDSAGNTDTKTRIINVVDQVTPGIIINGTYPVTIELNSVYNDEGATSYDIVWGDLTPFIKTTNTVNTKIVGTYTVTYSATDYSENTYTAQRIVYVKDVIPVITLVGGDNITIDINEKYNDKGATAADSIDGDLTPRIITYNPLLTNTSIPGTYTVTYNVSNIAGNNAEEVTRTVIVHDPHIPVISLNGVTPVTIERHTHYNDLHATASDFIDGDITNDIKVVNNVNSNKVGTYYVTYNVTDKAGNKAKTVTRTVNVVDVIPVIKLIGTTPISIDMNDTYVDLHATADDYVDGDISSRIIVHNPVITSKPGTYYVTYNVSNIAGIAAVEVTRTVTVHDPYIPVIVRNGDDPITVEMNSTYVDAGATATDKVDGGITSEIVTVNPVNTSIVGRYIVTYNVVDSVGNKAKTVTRTVNVVHVIPVIKLNGENPETIDLGVTYYDAGATAGDEIDGNLTSRIQIYNPVNTNVAGIYQVLYNVKNESGIVAEEVTRTVIVHDPYIPTIIMKGVTPITIEQSAHPSYVDAGAKANDKVDGDISGRIITVNNVNQKKVGTYTVTYNVTDSEGNKAHTVTRTVNVVNVAPVITLTGSNPVMVDLNEIYVDAGARASDPIDGDLTSDIKIVNPVDTSKPGIYTVTYNVIDYSGKAAKEVTRSVIVHDPYIPTILRLGITPVTIDRGETYIDAGAIATDKLDGDITAAITTHSNVNTDKAGTYIVSYNVTDYEGNNANTVTRIVIVQDAHIPYVHPKDSYYVGDSDEAITNSILTRGWNTAFARDTYNGKARVITPFRAVNNAGDYLARQDYKCGGPTGMSKSSIGWASSTIYLGSQINNCDDSGVPGASGNVKYVYDSSDYVTFRRQQAINRDIVRR